MLDVQRLIGNRAASALLQSGGSAPRAAHPTSHGHADDLEAEANRLATQVVDAPASKVRTPAASTHIRSNITRPVPAIVEHVLHSSGEPLDPASRAYLEPRFGLDFSDVQIHTDAQAAESARALNAIAYTSGQHVVFDAGAYDPATAPGLRLLAHELTHTLQQSGAPSASRTPVIQCTPDDAPKLPWHQQAQLDALEGKIKDWTEYEKTIARALLRKWIDLQNKKTPKKAIAAQIQDELLERYYRPWLEAQDAAVQKYCREHHLGPRERFGGGISCERLFTGDRQLGEGMLEDMRRYMKVTGPDEDEAPLPVVHQWVREYRNRTNEDQLRAAGIIMDVLGLVTAFATPGGKPLSPTPRVPSEPPGMSRPTAAGGGIKVGDVHNVQGMGGLRVKAVLPNGDVLYESGPVTGGPPPVKSAPAPAQPQATQKQLPAPKPPQPAPPPAGPTPKGALADPNAVKGVATPSRPYHQQVQQQQTRKPPGPEVPALAPPKVGAPEVPSGAPPKPVEPTAPAVQVQEPPAPAVRPAKPAKPATSTKAAKPEKPVKIATSTRKTTRKHAVTYPPVEYARPGRERPSVEPSAETAAGIKSAEQLHAAATESVAGLPRSKQKKTIAAGEGGQRMSGWRHIPESDVKATPRAVEEHSREIGHVLAPSKNDQVKQGGFSGQYHASHAEKQQIVAQPNRPVGVSRPMCNDCIRFFQREASFRGKTQIVSDSQCTRHFHPNGTITEYWRDGTIVRFDASGSVIAQPHASPTP